jgi:hypothetical protein
MDCPRGADVKPGPALIERRHSRPDRQRRQSFDRLRHRGQRVGMETGHVDLLSHRGCESVACQTMDIDRIRPPRRRIAGERPRLGLQRVPQRLPQERPAGP